MRLEILEADLYVMLALKEGCTESALTATAARESWSRRKPSKRRHSAANAGSRTLSKVSLMNLRKMGDCHIQPEKAEQPPRHGPPAAQHRDQHQASRQCLPCCSSPTVR